MTASPGPAERELRDYLHEHIPISAAMGIEVTQVADDVIRMWAPLEPNINHRNTVFGGSAAAVGILAGWALLHVRLGHGGRLSRIVIQRADVDYRLPIDGDFEAVARAPDERDWARFTSTIRRRGRGRIALEVRLERGGRVAGVCHGTYVVLPLSAEEE